MRIFLTIAALAVVGLFGYQAIADDHKAHEDSVMEEIGHEVDEVTDEMGLETHDETVGEELKHEMDEMHDEAEDATHELKEEMDHHTGH
ncbi:MAG TPA: hypothetical protein DHW10_00255 [Rhodospirillaceae bacterium]|nr:hypothetical protein [Rhodospirillaceae bacterium]